MSRRLMLYNAASKNGWEENNEGNGTSKYTVDSNGLISLTSFSASNNATNGLVLTLKKPIELVAGDNISIKLTKVSGSPPTVYTTCFILGHKQWTNRLFSSVFGVLFTASVTDNNTIRQVLITNLTGTKASTVKFIAELFLNGDKVI